MDIRLKLVVYKFVRSQLSDGSPLSYERAAKLVSAMMFWDLAAPKFIDLVVFFNAFFPLFLCDPYILNVIFSLGRILKSIPTNKDDVHLDKNFQVSFDVGKLSPGEKVCRRKFFTYQNKLIILSGNRHSEVTISKGSCVTCGT